MGLPVTVCRKLMGSPFQISTYDTRIKGVPALLAAALAEVARVEDLLTDFRDSPLNRINDLAGIEPVQVPAELFTLIEFAQDISRDSNGAFDISYAAVGRLWRKAFASGIPPSGAEISAARQFIDYRRIKLYRESRAVFLPDHRMRIGLGGIGKGYAVDRAYKLLRTMGLQNFVVNGAGDIRVHSAVNAVRPWNIGVRNPLAQANVAAGLVRIANGAVATSGDYERFMMYQGKKYHHIIDARSAEIRDDIASVTIMGPTTLMTDVSATCVMSLGLKEGLAFLQRQRDLKGFLVTPAGQVLQS